MEMSLAQVIDILKALLTPAIAVVTLFIAWQQWKTNKRKIELDRYERRLHIYQEIQRFISRIPNSRNVSIDELSNFRAAVSEADFIFGPEIPKYINEICLHWRELWRFNQEYRDNTQETPEGYNHQTISEGIKNHSIWLIKQLDISKEKFKKY